MGNFEQATAVTGDSGRFHARLDGDWCVWSPAGGYLLALVLRAAGRSSQLSEPLSMSCHFLAMPQLDTVELLVTPLRKAKVAEVLRVSMIQNEKPVVEATVWCGAAIEAGYAHSDARPPEVAGHDTWPEQEPPRAGVGFQTLWQNVEHRPCGPFHWQRKEPAAPRELDWIRLRDFPDDPDPFLDAGRLALVLDSFTWPAAAHAYVGDPRFIAPTISFAIDFQRRPTTGWLLSDAYAPCANAGRIASHNRVWSADGQLLALGNGTLLCRPRPQR